MNPEKVKKLDLNGIKLLEEINIQNEVKTFVINALDIDVKNKYSLDCYL